MSEYGPWTPVPIFQHEAEFEQLLDIYISLAPKAVLEIGSYHGGTMYHWLTNAKPGTVVVSVDNFETRVDNTRLYQEWCPQGVEFEVIRGDSRTDNVYQQVAGKHPYDFVFIDASHLYTDVKSDWDSYGPNLVHKGVVALHDILPGNGHPEIEVHLLWREIRADGYTTRELVDDPDADWGGIGCVFIP